MRSAAVAPLAGLRTGMITSAPARARRPAMTNPIPSLAPVTTASFPDRAGMVRSMVRATNGLPNLRRDRRDLLVGPSSGNPARRFRARLPMDRRSPAPHDAQPAQARADRTIMGFSGGCISGADGGSRQRSGLSGALMLVVGGTIVALQALTVPGREAMVARSVFAIGVLSVLIGIGLVFVPWQRLPRRAQLLIALLALVFIGAGNWVDPNPYLAAAFFFLVAMWIGIAQPNGTTLLMSPLFAVAYWWPMQMVPHVAGLEQSVPFVLIPCVLAGETLSWLMTQLTVAQRRLRDHDERRFQTLLAASSDTTLVLSATRDVSYASQSARQVLRLSAEDLTGRSITAFIGHSVHPDDVGCLNDRLDELFAGNGTGDAIRFRVAGPAGTWKDVEGVGRNLLADEAVRGVLFSLRDVSERAGLERELTQQACTDHLTGLPNRALLRDRIHSALDAAERNGHAVALLLIDLDRFKEVNDTLGHRSGDALLQQIAQRFERATRQSDTVARLGGDEFAVLLPDVTSIEDAIACVHRLRGVIEAEFLVDGLPMDIDASIGLAVYPDHAGDPQELLQHAEVAMYAAKTTHLDYAIYDAALNCHSPRRLGLLGRIRRALTNREFVVHYQPKADSRTRRVIGVEALVRWQHPEYGLTGPDEFIALAEATGLIRPLTSYVLDCALRERQKWLADGHDLSVAVNVSARCLLDLRFPIEVAAMLRDSGVPAEKLVLEITESAIMIDPVRALEVLDQLHIMNVQLSIDDFGTGYSSMAYLKDLPVDELKVDRSFVTHMRTQEKGLTIVRSTIDLAHNLGLRVVAEGVEDEETWYDLGVLGCDTIQGYYLARPLSAVDLTAWLAVRAATAGPASPRVRSGTTLVP
jgi:diguanylate cyclase (GGDEF)-like protein/PAS domain S-box-containing protein